MGISQGGPAGIIRQGGFPFFLPTLFGSGQDGDVTLTTNTSVGYLGSYGVKNAHNASLAAGQTLTIERGTGFGPLIIGCTGKLTIAGTITGSGAAGSNGVVDGGGAGGDSAGGGVAGAKKTSNGTPNNGVVSARIGLFTPYGAGSGSFQNNNAASSAYGTAKLPLQSTSTTYNASHVLNTLEFLLPSVTRFAPIGVGNASVTGGADGTTAVVYPTTTDWGPWAQTSVKYWSFANLGADQMQVHGGPVTGVVGQQAAGGGGGGCGNFVIFEADTIELVSGYAINLNGGNGGNGFSSNGTTAVAQGGPGGHGGGAILICRNLIGSTASINVNGGTKGTGAGTSVATALDGIAGGVYVIKV